ncbi:MAG: ethanolamine ammonia-lyase subunit EutC [Isosphaeraceae bacterium]
MTEADRPDRADLEAIARERTPARIFQGRAGASYSTSTSLQLREDHAFAVDAVRAELDLSRDLGPDFLARWDPFEVSTRARDRAEYLVRPDLGRMLADPSSLSRACPQGPTIQVAIGDGLSVEAVSRQVPGLMPRLADGCRARGWSFGRPLAIRNARVGVLNDIGEALGAEVVVLLIGERPGLATAESLSAYLAYRPRSGHTDADRNLVSNIHARGVSHDEAARRILALSATMMLRGAGGVAIKEDQATIGSITSP